jgi:hypothetical protein
MPKKKSNLKQVVKIESDFKPGDKPYYEYDGMILNANVPWNELVQELVQELLINGYSELNVAKYSGRTLRVIKDVLNKSYDGLCFRAGARIITLHSRIFPACY